MHIRKLFLLAAFLCSVCSLSAQRHEQLLETGWKFHKGEANGAEGVSFNDSQWESVCIPHDWAIYGPFDRNNDLQNVAITQNLEKQASIKTGRTGGLPYVGVGWYRTRFDADPDKKTTLVFDGAMSEAHVYINGKEACFWPFGYNSFHCDITELLHKEGKTMYWLYAWKTVLNLPAGTREPDFTGMSISLLRKNTYTCMGYTDYHSTRS